MPSFDLYPAIRLRASVLAVALALGTPSVWSQSHNTTGSTALSRLDGTAQKAANMPAGPLGRSLAQWAASTGVALSFDPELTEGRTSPALVGNLSVREGFTRLLAGSGLALVANVDGSFGLQRVTATGEVVTLSAVTVVTARAPKAASDLTSSITQVNREELAEQLTVSPNILTTLDTLVPGLTLSQAESRQGCFTNIRGRAAQFLINGVPTNDNLRASSCRGLFNISPYAVENIEVIRGSTALYGAGAPGGVVNLLTRRAKSSKQEVDIVAQVGFNPDRASATSEYNLYAGVGQKFEDSDYYLGGAFQDIGNRTNPDGGLVPSSTSRGASLTGSAGWRLAGGELRLTGLYFRENPDEAFQADGTQISGQRFATRVAVVEPQNPFRDQRKIEQKLLTLGYTHPQVLGQRLEASVYFQDESIIQRSEEAFEGEVFYFDSDATNSRVGLRTALTARWQSGASETELTYGLDLLRQKYYRPQIDPASGGTVIGFVSPEVILDQTALFLQPQWRNGRWLVSGGVRYERFDGKVGSKGFSPTIARASTPGDVPAFGLALYNLGAVYELSDTVQLFGGYSQGAEVSEFGRAARGVRNPALINLDGAKSDQVELGIRGRQGGVDFSAAIFQSESDKAATLQTDPSCAGQPFCPLIPLRLSQRIRGAEVSLDWRIKPSVVIGGVLTYQKGKFTEPGARPVPFGTDTLSPPRANLYLKFQPLPKWDNRIQLSLVGKTNEFDEQQQASGLRNTSGYSLVDFSSSYPVGPGRLSFGISNLLDKKYVNATGQSTGDFFYYLGEGRRASVTYAVRF